MSKALLVINSPYQSLVEDNTPTLFYGQWVKIDSKEEYEAHLILNFAQMTIALTGKEHAGGLVTLRSGIMSDIEFAEDDDYTSPRELGLVDGDTVYLLWADIDPDNKTVQYKEKTFSAHA